METMIRMYQKNMNNIIFKLFPNEEEDKLKEFIKKFIISSNNRF